MVILLLLFVWRGIILESNQNTDSLISSYIRCPKFSNYFSVVLLSSSIPNLILCGNIHNSYELIEKLVFPSRVLRIEPCVGRKKHHFDLGDSRTISVCEVETYCISGRRQKVSLSKLESCQISKGMGEEKYGRWVED